MSAYRFCRTDDVPALVDAFNRCRPAGDPDPPLTVERFRRAIREIDLWCSSCMLAHEGDDPIAVLLAAKRDTETLVHALAVHPDHQRRGHGRHLLASLGAKLAILGPPRLVAEVPAEWVEALAFLSACGYRHERDYVDWEQSDTPNRSAEADPLADLIVPIGVDELLASGALALDRGAPRSWDRAPEGLLRRKADLSGLALASDRVEAFVLYRERPAECEILALGSADAGRRERLVGLLVRRLARSGARSLRLPRVSRGEVHATELESWGFRPARTYAGMSAQAVPA